MFDAMCCRVWPLLFGVAPRRCGICGAVPVGIPGTERTVIYDPSNEPKLVATVKREEES